MDERKDYQPLLEKILENLSSEREARTPNELCAKFDLEVPTIQGAQIGETPPAPPVQSNESSHFYPDLDDLANLANTPTNTPPTLVERTENAKSSTTLPTLAPLPSLQIMDGLPATKLYTPPAIPSENSLDESPADFDKTTDLEDTIPVHFYHEEQTTTPERRPIRTVLFGLTGAVFLGALGVFLLPQDPPSLDNNMAGIEGPKLFPTQTDERLPVFSGTASNILAPSYSQENPASSEITIDEARTISLSGENPAEEAQPTGTPSPATRKVQKFASITGPLDALVQNVVKDLADTPQEKNLPVSEEPQIHKPMPRAHATLNQLEKSLANIVSLSSNSQEIPDQITPDKTTPAKKIVLAQNNSDQAAPVRQPPVDRMQALTDKVVEALSGLNETPDSGAAPLGQSVDRLRSSLADLVLEAESRGKSAGSVELLIKEALGDNQKNLPAALKNSDGTLDITTLIASIVKRADGNSGQSVADDSYLSLIEDEGKNTALTSRLIKSKAGKRYLIVKSGDSLSSIAYATYGDSFLYPKIYQANRSVVSNPNTLRIGTRLIIPE